MTMTMRGRGRTRGGALSLQEVVRIVTSALSMKERNSRLVEFTREREARRKAGFTPMEMEDLRELYNAYMSLEVEGKSNTVARLSKMFTACGRPTLSAEELSSLKDIVTNTRRRPADSDSEGAAASFDIFLQWMQEVFAQGIGGLQRPSSECTPMPSLEGLQGRHGFGVSMLRERLRRQADRGPSSPGGSSGGTPSSGPSPKALRAGSLTKRSSRESYPAGRSRAASTNSSKTNSRFCSRKESLKSDCTGVMGDAMSGDSVLNLKGLPPSEAMLARRQYRANSVDMRGVQGDANQLPLQQGLVANGSMPSGKLQELPMPAPAEQVPSLQAKRKVKKGLDSMTIVTDAIAKLRGQLDHIGDHSATPEPEDE
eukprot:gnl/TRDRNA2_/TRDRNA2_157754_c0_seq1.p1 gnl/TRDRNA2_/TRDRNA2_157754_c0~~gnl/TRDRNA2_/TRDRNA2_157754_c0_seq1.p1  ORF type:complete len:370 (+),score=69.31 gnl/TRDRNA2_/TRDRNA2_157754_c0_seq1:121-1230(+)